MGAQRACSIDRLDDSVQVEDAPVRRGELGQIRGLLTQRGSDGPVTASVTTVQEAQ